MARVDRRRDAGGRQWPGLHDLQRPGVSSHRAYYAGNGNHRRPVGGLGLFCSPSDRGGDDCPLGDGAAMMRQWRGSVAAVGRGAVPFAFILIAWALVTRAGVVPAMFLPPPGDVARTAW